MKNIYRLALMLFTGLTMGFAQPKIEVVGGRDRTFGTAYNGEKLIRTVTLKNIGSDTLKISNVTASCGCTATSVSAYSIAPLDTSMLTITFNSKGSHGTLTKGVNVEFKDAAIPTVHINFKVNVVSVLDLTPSLVSFMDYEVGSPMTKKIQVKNTTASDITILSMVSKDPQIATELPKRKLKPGEGTELTLKLSPKTPVYLTGEIQITTDFEPYPVLTVNYNGIMKKEKKN